MGAVNAPTLVRATQLLQAWAGYKAPARGMRDDQDGRPLSVSWAPAWYAHLAPSRRVDNTSLTGDISNSTHPTWSPIPCVLTMSYTSISELAD